MKSALRKLFSPILSLFEDQDGDYVYKSSHRLILKVMGSLFLVISVTSLAACIAFGQWGGILPVLVFFSAGLVCLVVGFLGTDKAVAKIWNSRT